MHMPIRIHARTIARFLTPLCLSVIAQTFAAERTASSNHIEDIVVTARHRDEASQQVPIPITAITGQQLEDRASFDMHDLERITPNLSYQNSAVAKNSANIFLRGIGQANWGPAQDPKVGVYLNGVYIGRAQGGLFDLLDIERVEVLRGPQGTLFGRNTTAGLIQVITRAPEHEFGATGKLGAGKDGERILAGTVNVPITDSIAFRIASQLRKQDGYINNKFDGSKWNDVNAFNNRGTLAWSPSENFEATLGVDYQRVRERPSLATCHFLGPVNGATAGGLENIAWVFGSYDAVRANCNSQHFRNSYEDDPNHHSDIDAFGEALTLHWKIGAIGELTSITAYRHIREINGSWGFVGDSVKGNVLEIQQPRGTHNEFAQRSQEFRLNGTSFGDKLEWVGGIYFFDEDARQHFGVPLFGKTPAPSCAEVPQFCIPIGGGATLGGIGQFLQIFASNNLDYDANNRSKAIYSEGTYHFTDSLALTAGIRYTSDHRNLSLTQTLLDNSPDPGYKCPNGGAPVQNKCKRIAPNQSKLTPRFILSYQATDSILVYGSWSEGYSSGGLNQTPRLETYRPEVSRNWELGFKSQLFDQRLRLNMTTFYNNYENQQESVGRLIDNQPVVAILNAQKAKLWGFETEITAAPGAGWLINFAYGVVNGKYDQFSVIDHPLGPPPDFKEITIVRDISNTKVIRGSPYTYNFGVSKSFHVYEDTELATQVGWSYRARRFDDLQAAKFTRQDPYGLLDARLSLQWKDGKAVASLWGTNLLDKKFTLSRGGAPTDNIQRIYWGPPREFGLELTYNFGAGK